MIAAAGLLLGGGMGAAAAQTNAPALTAADTTLISGVPSLPSLTLPFNLDVLTNLPTTTNFATASLGLETGVLVKSGGTENYVKGDYYFRTNWMASGEIQNAPVSVALDSASFYFGYRKVWANAELYGQAGGRYTWASAAGTKSCFQGALLGGLSYIPMTGGKVSINLESVFLTSDTGNVFKSSPKWEIRGGPKILF